MTLSRVRTNRRAKCTGVRTARLAAEHAVYAHPRENAVERVRQELRPGRQFTHPIASRDMVRVRLVELAQELDAVHEFGYARGDVVVAIEANGAVGDCLGPA